MTKQPAAPNRPLAYGEQLVNRDANSNRNARFALWSLAGRQILLCAVSDPSTPHARAAIAALDVPQTAETTRVTGVFTGAALEQHPHLAAFAERKLVFSDAEALKAARLLGPDGEDRWVLLDPTLRATRFFPIEQAQEAIAAYNAAPEPDDHAGVPLHAPVLIVPRVFEPEFCKVLIDYYNKRGGEASGITVQNADGIASVQLNPSFKKRSDCIIDEEDMRKAIMQRFFWRLTPEIEKAFMWRPTRMERYLVACYDTAEGGYFKPHRDNTTNATRHRRFACTLNLNAEDYDGGDLRFPEFGQRTYRAPTGGAVIFSCALMHEATPMTRGQRYAFLPFLYDEAAAKIRAENNQFVDNETIKPYAGA